MIFGIQLPQWLIDFWTVYGNVIAPVLLSIAMALLSYVAVKIKADSKVNQAKADAQIKALQEVAEKPTGEEQNKEVNAKLEQIAISMEYLLQMYELAFQNSSLDPAVKENLANLANCVRYGTQDELIAQQQKQIDVLNSQIAELNNQINHNMIEEVKQPEQTVTVERR